MKVVLEFFTALAIWTLAGTAVAGPVFSVAGGSGGIPIGASSHGWEFTANASILVTHLGLYDGRDNGMDISHPIGIYRLSDATLLTSGTVNAGVGDTLIDSFRYIDTPDVTLDIGEAYVIAFYSATRNSDTVLSSAIGLSVDPVITYGPSRRFELSTSALVLPTSVTTRDRIGPNFLFEIIPEPTTLALAGLGLSFIAMRRRR